MKAQIAIAWLVARPSVTAPIASVTNLHQLNEQVKAVQLELEAEAIELLNRATEPMSRQEIAVETNHNVNSVSVRLSQLVHDGVVARAGRNRYALPRTPAEAQEARG